MIHCTIVLTRDKTAQAKWKLTVGNYSSDIDPALMHVLASCMAQHWHMNRYTEKTL